MEDRPLFSNKDQVYTIRMDRNLSEQFKKLAAQKNMKPSRFLRQLIREALKAYQPDEPKRPVGRPRKISSELKENINRSKNDRAAILKEYEEIQRAFNRYANEIHNTLGSYILKEHEKGNLDPELSEALAKIIDNI